MIVTALLVKYAAGYHWVEDAAGIAAYGRREGFLSLSAETVDEVERIVAALFVEKAAPQVSTTAAIEPTGVGDRPYVDFGVADWITAPDESTVAELVRVRGLGVAEDDDGNISYPLVLRSSVSEFEDRVSRWLKRMSNGTLGGTVESSAPLPSSSSSTAGDTTPSSDDPEVFEWGSSGLYTFAEDHSGPVTAERDGELYELTIAVDVVASDDLVIAIDLNGVEIDTFTLPAGDGFPSFTDSFGVGTLVLEGDALRVRKVSGGTAAEGVTVKVRSR